MYPFTHSYPPLENFMLSTTIFLVNKEYMRSSRAGPLALVFPLPIGPKSKQTCLVTDSVAIDLGKYEEKFGTLCGYNIINRSAFLGQPDRCHWWTLSQTSETSETRASPFTISVNQHS